MYDFRLLFPDKTQLLYDILSQTLLCNQIAVLLSSNTSGYDYLSSSSLAHGSIFPFPTDYNMSLTHLPLLRLLPVTLLICGNFSLKTRWK